MNEMQIFHYENNEIRTILKDGEPWWVLADVCQVLLLHFGFLHVIKIFPADVARVRLYAPQGPRPWHDLIIAHHGPSVQGVPCNFCKKEEKVAGNASFWKKFC